MKKLLLPFLCIGLLFASCSDDDNTSKNGDVTDASEYFDQNRENAKQEVIINTSQLPKTITLDEGVKITIKEGTFTKDGQPVEGNITLEIYEMLKPSSIIFSGTNTNYAWGSYLETDGFIYINAKQDGKNLDEYLARNLTISIPTDKADGTNTQLWIGTEDAGEDGDQFAWVDMMEDALNWDDMEGNQQFSTVWSKDGVFEFSFGKLGWCNCDVIWGDGAPKTTVTVALTGNVGELASYLGYSGDTFVFFCGKGAPIVAQLYTKVNDTTVKSYDNSMPIGADGKLIAFSIADGKFSFASKNIKIEENMTVTLDLKEISKSTLDNEIKSIDGYSK